jgi:DNA-directed RNA polymerase subunit RPC12/RpoP
MPRRVPEQTRQAIREDLKAGQLTTRQIQAKYRVSAGTVSDVKQEAGMPVAKRSPSAREQAAEQPAKEADGLKEYLPPAAASTRPSSGQQEGKPARQSCSSCKAAWHLEQGEHPLARCPKCNVGLGATAPEDEIYGCGTCGARWQLDKDDQHMTTCPKCGVRFVH